MIFRILRQVGVVRPGILDARRCFATRLESPVSAGLEAHRATQWRAPLGRGPGCATAGGKQRLCYQEADFRVERSTALDSGFALRSCLVAPRALGLAYVGPSRTSGLVSGRPCGQAPRSPMPCTPHAALGRPRRGPTLRALHSSPTDLVARSVAITLCVPAIRNCNAADRSEKSRRHQSRRLTLLKSATTLQLVSSGASRRYCHPVPQQSPVLL